MNNDGIYFRKKNRLEGYDYSNGGYYFITTCVDRHRELLGEIIDSKCELNKFGNIVEKYLLETAVLYPYMEIDYYVIMPNHAHIIIIIDPSKAGDKKIKSLSDLIGVFKSRSSAAIRREGLTEFKWQPSFYDRIIRNEKELYNIRRYIEQNPLRWEIEEGFTENTPLD
ncbi:MAG: transposase [Ignavibacteriaceae bacterium]|nr:transposase [Ignavibacteriaceae bacterium]